MLKELCKDKKKLINKKLGKVLVGVLSYCMFLSGCKSASQDEISWELEGKSIEVELASEESVAQSGETNGTLEEMTDSQVDMIYVYICGAVTEPGVYQIAEGSRLFELIDESGGMLETADVTSQNLARVVQDGEQIQILTKEEAKERSKSDAVMTTGNIGQQQGLVNINTATVQELTTLTGIGESRALAIIAYREENGLFQSIDGIKKVTGIKEGLFERIKNQITI